LKKKKILVTGGAGFIGSHIVDQLIEDNYEVTVVDNLTSGSEKNVNDKARLYQLDIQDSKLETIFQKEHPLYVIHQAAQKDVRFSVADPIFDAKVNILGTINILQNCIQHNVKKIVFASTGGAIYGEQETFPAPEIHPARPMSPYGITKLVAEHYLDYYKTVYQLDYISLRYANVYGPRQDSHGEAGVIAIFVQKMLNGETPLINGDGDQTRDFVFVQDVVRANLLAMRNNSEEHIFNIGTGIETTVNQIFSEIAKLIDSSIEKKHGPAKEGEQRRSVIECTRAKEVLHWKPDVSLVDGLKKTCEYLKTNERFSDH
jgi:UDP-glucose 4-epimerase